MKQISLSLSLIGGLLVPTLAHAATPADAKPFAKDGMVSAMPLKALAQMTPTEAAPAQTLPSGVQFVTSLDRTAPRVAISLLIGAGAADETPDTAGWRRLLVGALIRSAPQGYDEGASETEKQEALTRAAEQLGGTLSVSVGDDVTEFSVVGESARGVDLLKLALALLQNPRLSDEDLNKARERQLDRVDAEDLDVNNRIETGVRSQIFRDASGDLTGYGLPDNGTQSSLQALDNAALRALQAKFARAPLTVAAAGDVDVAGMRAVLEVLPARAPITPAAPAFAAPKVGAPPLVVRELPTDGAYVFVSYPLADFQPADAPAMRVLVAALGDAKGARLAARLSNGNLVKNAPQAEEVGAQLLPRRYANEVLLTAQTDAQSVDGVKNVLLDEVRKLREGTLSATELQRAKAYARGDWSLERQGLRARAFLTGLPVATGQTPDATWLARLDAVSAADVKRVANQYLKPYAVALVMPKQ